MKASLRHRLSSYRFKPDIETIILAAILSIGYFTCERNWSFDIASVTDWLAGIVLLLVIISTLLALWSKVTKRATNLRPTRKKHTIIKTEDCLTYLVLFVYFGYFRHLTIDLTNFTDLLAFALFVLMTARILRSRRQCPRRRYPRRQYN